MTNPDLEQFAAQRLARTLDSAARVLADAAAEVARLAEQARTGDVRAGYAYLPNRAYSVTVNALPNLGLPQAFDLAATADQARATKEAES